MTITPTIYERHQDNQKCNLEVVAAYAVARNLLSSKIAEVVRMHLSSVLDTYSRDLHKSLMRLGDQFL
jgi:hypothetical protein